MFRNMKQRHIITPRHLLYFFMSLLVPTVNQNNFKIFERLISHPSQKNINSARPEHSRQYGHFRRHTDTKYDQDRPLRTSRIAESDTPKRRPNTGADSLLILISKTRASVNLVQPKRSPLRHEWSINPKAFACFIFSERVTYSKLETKLFVLTPSKWLTSYPSGLGPINASATTRCTSIKFVTPGRLRRIAKYPHGCFHALITCTRPLTLSTSPKLDTKYCCS